MPRKIDLRVRQLGGSYQIKDPAPGANSPWFPDVGRLTKELEEYANGHPGDSISVSMSSIYEGDMKKIIEAMKRYKNVSFG
jgi:hypothetical protein